MSRQFLGYSVILSWLLAAVSLDRLRDVPGLMARHHAGILDPWISILIVIFTTILAVSSTIAWWRKRGGASAADR